MKRVGGIETVINQPTFALDIISKGMDTAMEIG